MLSSHAAEFGLSRYMPVNEIAVTLIVVVLESAIWISTSHIWHANAQAKLQSDQIRVRAKRAQLQSRFVTFSVR